MQKSLEEGYLLLALGPEKYIHLALNAALSIRRCDNRPICLLINETVKLPNLLSTFFDIIIRIPDEPSYLGAINKFRVYQNSPFHRTMYIDCDCIMIKKDIEFFWQNYRGNLFAIEGWEVTEGEVHRKNAAELCRALSIPYVATFNSGIFYFEKSEVTRKLFETAINYFNSDKRDQIGYYLRPNEWNDEPFLGVAMGACRVKPVPYIDKLKRLQACLPYSRDHYFDLDRGECYYISGATLESAMIVSGTIAHFTQLEPRREYLILADKLRREACLDPYEIKN